MKKLLPYFCLLFVGFAGAAVYTYTNKAGTVLYANGIPTGLTTAQKAKLKAMTLAQTDTQAAIGLHLSPRAAVKAQIINDEKPVPCGAGFTGFEPNCVPISLMPMVDVSKELPIAGFETRGTDKMWVRTSTAAVDIPIKNASSNGEFRIDCDVSHMSNDDPIIYPNQQGAAHHHTFFGNTATDYKSTYESLSAATARSTCRGGSMNKSAYWVPSMIDTSNGTPLVPTKGLWYYKGGYRLNGATLRSVPKGLRMIAGKMKSTSPQSSRFPEFTCQVASNINLSPPSTKNIPACAQGDTIVSHVEFPQCWDGVNLDSPSHQDHVAEPVQIGGVWQCPATHPVGFELLTLNLYYKVTTANGTADWRLSSDNYAKNGYNAGYSSHADFMEAWDRPSLDKITTQCINPKLECGNKLLGLTPNVGYEIMYKRCVVAGVERDC